MHTCGADTVRGLAMTWYAPPEPPWDVCWDFKKGSAQQKGGKAGGSKGAGKGWKSWGWEEPSYAMPPWWGMQAPMAAPWGTMPPWMPAPAGQHTALKAPSAKKKESGEPVLPAFLEKRFAERRGGEAAAAGPPAHVYQPPPEKEYEGSLKSISGKHGYGFVVCDETHRIYGRDVYLPKDAVPEDVKALDRLRFNLVLSAKGHPQARNVTTVNLGPAA